MNIKNTLALVSLAVVVSGCAVVGPGGNRGTTATEFAADQANEMNVNGGKFMQKALGAQVCPNGASNEKLGVDKAARISNTNGAVRFHISYNGGGSTPCQ